LVVISIPDSVLEDHFNLNDEEPINLDELIKNWMEAAYDFNKLNEKELRDESCGIVQSLLQMKKGQFLISNC